VHDGRYVDLLIMFDGAKLQNKFDMTGDVSFFLCVKDGGGEWLSTD
jgi:hypothetical protein